MMSRIRRLIGGFSALLRKDRVEQELDDELRTYLETSIDQKVRAGMSREQAVRAARVELGSLDAVKEYTRDVGWEAHAENLWRDVRYASRMLRRSPAFTSVAVLTLTLGIGANTAIFSVVNAVMLRPLPVDRPDELISLAVVSADGTDSAFSYAAYRQFASEATRVADVFAASSARPDAIAIDGVPEGIVFKWVSGNYFTLLGVQAAAGRMLMSSDDRVPSGQPIAVLSDAYWARRFGRDASAIGRVFRFRDVAFTIVGVAQRGFFGETGGEAPDVWMPLTSQPRAPSYLWEGHSTTWLRILARRRPGIPFAEAVAGLEPVYGRIRNDIAGELRNEYRKTMLESRLSVRGARSGSPALRDSLSTPLLILMGIVGLVLLIACANVANLMLARAAARRRQTAVCLAIGASRVRLVRQALIEALLLAAAGGAGGLLLAAWGTRVLATLMSGALPVAIDASPDLRVLGFAILVSCATAVAFGLLPALRTARIDPLPALKISGLASHGATRIPLGRALVVTQIAVSLVLLVAAGLFVRSLVKIQGIDTGFDPDRVLLLEITPPLDEQPQPDLYRRLLAQAESVPGIRRASASSSGVFNRGTWGNAISVEGYVPRSGVTPRTFANAVSTHYFEVMRIAVLSGRGFTDDDRSTTPKVTVVNQTFAQRFFGETDAIGKRVGLCSSDPCSSSRLDMMEIVGVTKDAKYVDLREDRRPMLYVPIVQRDDTLRELEVLTAGDPGSVATMLRRALSGIDRRLSTVSAIELREHVDASLVGERLTAKLSAAFGLLALALAAVGLYGVLAYVTTQRTAEIGLRMALGADRRQVRRLVLRDIFWLVLAGAGIGVPAALAGARLLERQLYGVAPTDPLSVSAALITLIAAALAAGYVPARRATRVDPLIALRAE